MLIATHGNEEQKCDKCGKIIAPNVRHLIETTTGDRECGCDVKVPDYCQPVEIMLEPTKKAPAIDKLISDTMGKDRVVTIELQRCMTCPRTFKDPNTEFKDELSKKEYRISGMCQVCQDSVFGGSDED